MENLMMFEDNEVEVLEFNGKVLFNPKHVAEILGIKNVRDNVSKMNSNQVIKLTNSDLEGVEFRKLNNRGENFLTERGLSILISKTNKISSSEKQSIIESFRNNGYNIVLIALSRDEIEFLDLLESVLESFGYNCIRQYKCNSYRIDLYIEDLKVAIEYDENSHNGYSYESQEGRQKEIEESLGCRFIRVGDKNSHAYNVGLIMKQLLIRNC